MKCPWCGEKMEPSIEAWIIHSAVRHTDELKALAGAWTAKGIEFVTPKEEPEAKHG